MTRTSSPCDVASVKRSTARPSGRRPNGARVTVGVTGGVIWRGGAQPQSAAKRTTGIREERSEGICLTQEKQDCRIEGIATEARSVDCQPTGQRVVDGEPN